MLFRTTPLPSRALRVPPTPQGVGKGMTRGGREVGLCTSTYTRVRACAYARFSYYILYMYRPLAECNAPPQGVGEGKTRCFYYLDDYLNNDIFYLDICLNKAFYGVFAPKTAEESTPKAQIGFSAIGCATSMRRTKSLRASVRLSPNR